MRKSQNNKKQSTQRVNFFQSKKSNNDSKSTPKNNTYNNLTIIVNKLKNNVIKFSDTDSDTIFGNISVMKQIAMGTKRSLTEINPGKQMEDKYKNSKSKLTPLFKFNKKFSYFWFFNFPLPTTLVIMNYNFEPSLLHEERDVIMMNWINTTTLLSTRNASTHAIQNLQ